MPGDNKPRPGEASIANVMIRADAARARRASRCEPSAPSSN